MAETTLAALDGFADIDTVMRAVETVNAHLIGAIRREITNLRAERVSGLSERDWQRASGPHVTRMLATGRFPALARAVSDGTDVDAEASFATALEWVLDAVAVKLARPPACQSLSGKAPAHGHSERSPDMARNAQTPSRSDCRLS